MKVMKFLKPLLGVFVICVVSLTNQCSTANNSGKEAPTLLQNEQSQKKDSNVVDVEEYSVYSVVLSDDGYIDAKTRQVVIRNHTLPGFTGGPIQSGIHSLSRETIDDYESKNKSTTPLKAELNLKVRYTLISDEEVDKIFHDPAAGWETFFSKFPGSKGLINLSRVGFNSDRTQAIVHVGIGCGGTCGDTQVIFLRKDNNQWRVEARFLTSVS